MKHDVSIIIPIYCSTEKSLEWLGECLDSACSQDCEVIAVDDGSPIDVGNVIKKFKRRIHFDHIPHIGVAGARNAAVLRATSKAIIPLDCDDRFTSGAIDKLVSAWDGEIPIYPDVRKFGLENVAHYKLPEFSCDYIYNHVGFTSVNVLHLKDQWKSIGGWNESIEFYEDGEYNARLFARYCGKHFPEPLVEYRIHEYQRTKVYKSRSRSYAKQILALIRRLDMPCASCSKRRNPNAFQSNPNLPQQGVAKMVNTVDVASLPGEVEGRVLAQYIGGKGRGKHYYRGLSTKFPYKVIYGDYVYVDPSDLRESGKANSLLTRVNKPTPAPRPVARPLEVIRAEPVTVSEKVVSESVSAPKPVRTPKTEIKRIAKRK